jgi:hypothetical protein
MNKQHPRRFVANAVQKTDPASTDRAWIRDQLDAIAAAVQIALWDADLAQPVFFCVPSSGDAILTFATPLDPSDADWNKISAIVSGIVGEKTALSGLTTRDLRCSVATGAMAVADFHAGLTV